MATLRLGAVAAPLGVLLTPREVRHRLEVAGAAVLVTTQALASSLGDAGTRVLAVDPAGLGVHEGSAAPAAVARREDDVAVLIFTSGTTGDARAAELTHGGIAWNARALADAFALTADDVQLAAAPLSHVLGMTGVMNASLVTGGAIALMERFEASAAFSLLASAGITGRGGGAADVRRSAARGAEGRGLRRGYVSQWRAVPRSRRRSRALWKRHFSARCAKVTA